MGARLIEGPLVGSVRGELTEAAISSELEICRKNMVRLDAWWEERAFLRPGGVYECTIYECHLVSLPYITSARQSIPEPRP